MLFLSRTKKLIFTPYIFITNKDLRLRTLTNNFWLFDNKFLGTWKVIKNCCKFLLHFSGKCASDYMHFRWNSNWEKALALNSFEFLILWKLRTEEFFISFSFFDIKFVYGMWMCFSHEIHMKHNFLDRVWIWSISYIKMNCINESRRNITQNDRSAMYFLSRLIRHQMATHL